MSNKIFITGTGTDVGKTFVAALMIKKLKENGYNPAYFKAAMSGNVKGPDNRLQPGDALYVKKTSRIDQPVVDMCPYVYAQGVSPHLAARMEGNPVQMEVIQNCFHSLCRTYDYITMEGSGGILCPIRYDQVKIQLEDVIQQLNMSCILVADAGLGTINAVCLTVSYMKMRGIPIKGIILNHFHPGNVLEQDNLNMCEQMTGCKVITCVQDGQKDLTISADVLASLYDSRKKEIVL